MELKFAYNLKIEADIPLLNVEGLQLLWKPNEHAVLSLEGCINNKIPYQLENLYNSRLTLSLEQNEKAQTLFCGHIMKAEQRTASGIEMISLLVLSGSCLLDNKESCRSFQSIEKTYSETARQAVESIGGGMISTIGADRKLNRPVIQFEETTWQFVKRLAGHLGGFIIPDIITGNPNLWFGMRKGLEIPEFNKEEYTAAIKHNVCGSAANETSYRVESRDFYKIGDRTTFLDEKVLVVEVSASLRQGELVFFYLLKRAHAADSIYQDKFTGLSLSGTVIGTKGESVKVALDIDNGVSTGDYFYPWYSKTGNVLYAVPEIGARIELYVPGADERDSFVTECLPEKKDKRLYEERCLVLEDGNYIRLFDSLLSFSRNDDQTLSLSDGSVAVRTSKQLQLSAEGQIRLRAKQINVRSEDEIIIYKS